MRKTSKKILGVAGLTLVAVMTVIAILLPGGASALETNPSTDEVEVRVVGSVPKVTITHPDSGSIFVEPQQYFTFSFENVNNVTAEVYYTDASGEEHVYLIDTLTPDYEPGSSSEYTLDLLSSQYGYGDYKIVVKGTGFDGVTSEDTVAFTFCPVYGTVERVTDDGVYDIKLHYDQEAENLDTIILNVYDEAGNLVDVLSPALVKVPGTEVELPFGKNDLESGKYTIEIIAVNADGEPLAKPYYLTIDYTAPEDDNGGGVAPAPDTGRFFGAINMSSADVVLTGVMVFAVVAIVAIGIIISTRRDKATKAHSK